MAVHLQDIATKHSKFAFFLQWIEAREKFEQAAELMGADSRAKKTIWGQFWSAHQVSTIIMIMIVMMTITVIIIHCSHHLSSHWLKAYS